MDNTMFTDFFMEDSLSMEDSFLTNELMLNENDTTIENIIVYEDKIANDIVQLKDSNLEEHFSSDEYYDISDSESGFNLDLEKEDGIKVFASVEEASAINFSFKIPVDSSNEVANNKKKILEKFGGKGFFEHRNSSISEPVKRNHFDQLPQSIIPASFSFIKNNNIGLIGNLNEKKKYSRMTVFEGFWKNKVNTTKKYSNETIKKCFDLVTINNVEHILAKLVDNSYVPIPWSSFPLSAYNKILPLKKFIGEDRKKRRRRQTKIYKEMFKGVDDKDEILKIHAKQLLSFNE
ncbi:Hypothetical protein SRAE_2000040200 [Strongyloides ratti]|uniref:Uncharacterized protein n=1 Tax=Strongyloides ratti TaxID=34506 RepID=A0A090L7I5_STRRB|nr:Hypothetical protein SRAE_2000040200 [Strongyloides ratti]CEF65726.1 Hypothetical protein SRAE_2000040200 [Strongyloides ratti]